MTSSMQVYYFMVIDSNTKIDDSIQENNSSCDYVNDYFYSTSLPSHYSSSQLTTPSQSSPALSLPFSHLINWSY